MPYVKFTEHQKDQVRRTDIADLIHRTGGKLKRSGLEYEWMDGSQKRITYSPLARFSTKIHNQFYLSV